MPQDNFSPYGNEWSIADDLANSGASDVYTANQSPLDAIDNGAVTSNNGVTTVSPPGWLSTIGSIFGTASKVVDAGKVLSGSTTKPATTVAKPDAGSPASGGLLSGSKLWIILAGGAALLVGAFLFFKRH
jgi:hypothetical protein